MSYRTILMHVNDERRVPNLVSVATRLADQFEAHLIALYVMPPIPTYGGTSVGAGMIKSGLATFRKEAERVHAAFEEACKGQPVVPEWRLVEAKGQDVAETILDHGRGTDLIIASQSDPDFDFTTLLDVPERLAIEGGRPVLVVPHTGRYGTVGKRVTIAWNGKREAARATFDALPLLKTADSVRIVWISPKGDRSSDGDLATAEIAATLARHGVKCEATCMSAADLSVGDALLSGLSDDGADLLVMGAYGHSRIREFVFGGATRHILSHMTAPVLLSH